MKLISQLIFLALITSQSVFANITHTPSNEPYEKKWPKLTITSGELLLQSYNYYLKKDVVTLKQINDLIADAEKAFKLNPFTVIDKTLLPASGNKHDYYSFGPYWWPDTTKPDGLPYIRRDGEINPETRGDNLDQVRLQKMSLACYSMAMAYWFTRKEKYRAKTIELIQVWFINDSTRMNPHLQFGQAIPGKNNGRDIGIIETKELIKVVEAMTLMNDRQALNVEFKQSVVSWFKEYVNWLSTSKFGISERYRKNNHGTWYDAQFLAFRFFIGDEEAIADYISKFSKPRLQHHIMVDGTQPHELKRTKSLSYSLMNLNGFVIIDNIGVLVNDNKMDEGIHINRGLIFLINNNKPRGEWQYKQTHKITRKLYNLISQTATLYNHNHPGGGVIAGARNLPIDLTDWSWLLYGSLLD